MQIATISLQLLIVKEGHVYFANQVIILGVEEVFSVKVGVCV